jgi:hypothetical protein
MGVGRNFFLVLSVAYIYFQPIYCSAQSDANWKKDIAFLKIELPAKHVNLFFKKDKEYFNSSLDAISNSITGNTDSLAVAIKLQQVIASMGDAHTSVRFRNYLNKKRAFPFTVGWLSDGVYIVSAETDYESLLCKKLSAINDFPIATIIDSLSSLITLETSTSLKAEVHNLIQFLDLLEYFKFATQDSISVRFKDVLNGQEDVLQISKNFTLNQPVDSFIKCRNNTPYYLESPTDWFRFKYINKDSIIYIQYNKCWSREVEKKYGTKETAKEMPSFKEFEKDILKRLNETAVKKIIFDVRFNGGGSSPQGKQFVDKVLGQEKFRGKVYIITGRLTFSSAVLNAVYCKYRTNAIVVGEEPANMPNHYGEVSSFKLPESGLRIHYSRKYFQIVNPHQNTFKPDIETNISINDVMNGIDPAYEIILKQ